jgi:hypothetical protein
VNTRLAGVVLLVVGVVITLVGLGARVFLTEDEGHHDGRTPTFAAQAAIGADALVTAVEGTDLAVWVERAGQPLTDFDELHGGTGSVFVASEALDWYGEAAIVDGDGRTLVELPGDGTYRVVVQAAPSGGPDLLELGATVVVGDGSGAATAATDQSIAVDDVWVGDDLTIERQGLDFVLSEDFDGPDTAGAPAFLVMFHAGDLRFTHAHAELVEPDRFRFAADLPGRGEYLAALHFVQGGQPVTALFLATV